MLVFLQRSPQNLLLYGTQGSGNFELVSAIRHQDQVQQLLAPQPPVWLPYWAFALESAVVYQNHDPCEQTAFSLKQCPRQDRFL